MDLKNNSAPDLTTEDDQFKRLAEYWDIIQGRWQIVVAITSIALVVSLVYFSLLPNVYTAYTKLLVEASQNIPKIAEGMVLAPVSGEEDTYYGTQIAILTGSKISEIVQSELKNPPGYSARAWHEPKTRIITLSVTHKNPQWSAKIANKFAEAYIRQSKEEGLFLAQQMLQWLPEDADLLQDDEAIKQLPGFDKAEFAETLSSITQDPVLQKYKKERLELKDKIHQLSQRYRPKHPTMIALNEQLSFVEKEIRERTQKILVNVRATLEGKLRITNIRVLDPAAAPGKPSGPDRFKGVMMAMFAGLALSVLLVLFLEYFGQKIREEKDLHPTIALPFLGYVPLIKEIAQDKKGKAAGETRDVSLVRALQKEPILSDATANIRTHLLFSIPHERAGRIMLTSSIPGEGKSTVATLLALSLTGVGGKILLIDADMRRPHVHTYLGVPNEKGLSDFLIGAATLEEVISSVKDTNLQIITAGGETPNSTELLASKDFSDLLDRVSKYFDKIVIDVAPVLYLPDGLIVAKHVYSSVLVCGSNMAQKKVIKTVKDKFDAIGNPFIGVIINRADYIKEGHRYQYFKTYHKHYTKTEAKK